MSLGRFEHVILTRYNLGLYERDDAEEWMEHRMGYFVETRKSVLSQEVAFKWLVCVDPKTPEECLDRIFTDSRMVPHFAHPNTYRSVGWTITTRFDNDDIYLSGALRAIQDAFIPEEIAVDIKYLQLYKDELYTSERTQPNSPFISLIENGARRTCYARPHTKMSEDFKAKFASDEVYAYMVIHENNLGNKLVGRKV